MSDSEMDSFDWDDDFEWLDAEIAEELDASRSSSDDESPHDISAQKDEESKSNVFKFVSSMQQMEYNFYGKLAKSCDYGFIKERIESNVETASLIASHLGFKRSNLSDLYYFNILLRQVAFIETSAREGGASFNQMVRESGDSYIKELLSINTDDSIYLEDELTTNDISLQIKSALLPYALYYEAFIQKTTSKNRADLEKYILMIVSMAKDISTRWQKNNTLLNKAVTFTTILPIVARFSMQQTEVYLSEQINKTLTQYSFVGKDVYRAIEAFDGGFNDHAELKSQLIDKVNAAIDGQIDRYISTSWRQDKLFPRDHVKIIILEKLYEPWVTCCKQEVIAYKKLSDSERAEYRKSHHGVMDVSTFFNVLGNVCESTIKDAFLVPIEWKKLEMDIREKFSMYWGVSDAIYKSR